MRIKCQKTFLAGALAVSLASLQAQAALVHRYSFDDTGTTIKDSVGTANGTLNSPAPQLSDGMVYLNYLATANKSSSDPTGDYISFPTNTMAGLTNVTIDAWFKGGSPTTPTVPTWARLFDFGSSANNNGVNYIFFTPHSGTPDNRFVVQSGVGEQTVAKNTTLEGNGNYHVTCVFDFTTHYMELYNNGVQVARAAINTNANPTNINYQNVWIGRSNYGGDPYFMGAVDEFRIYNSSLTAPEVAANDLAGAASTSATVAAQLGSAAAMSFLQGGTNQTAASLMERTTMNVTPAADFANNGTTTVTNIPLFRVSGLTLTSSDPTIATVTDGGQVSGVKPGSVTLTATYGGKTATFSVTVTNDITAPTVTSVDNGGYNRVFNVIFSKALDTNSAQTLSNYTIDNGAIKVQSATLLANNTVRLYTDVFDPALTHQVAISGVTDLAFTPNPVAATNITVGWALTYPANGMTWKIWTNNINNFANWKASTRFPNGPDAIGFITNGEAASNTGTNNYGCVYQAYFVPTNTANYYFSIATDDNGELFVSTNDDPSFVTASPISQITSWTGSRNFGNQVSAPMALVAGQKYYMQINYRQGSGGDNCAVACALTNSIPNASLPIPGSMLIPYVYKPIPMKLAYQTGDQALLQGQDASFTVAVSSVPAPSYYQWYRNGQIISNATSKTYNMTLITKSNDDQATFYCVVSNLVDCVTSAPAKLSITIDTNPPVIVKVNGSATMDRVNVQFSKRMNATVVNAKANYSIAGLTISSVVLDSSLTNAVIYTSKQTPKMLYTVTFVTNSGGIIVCDVAQNRAILTNTTAGSNKMTFNAYDAAPGYTFVRYFDNYTAGVDNLYSYSTTNTPTRQAVYNDFGTLNFNDPGIANYGGIAEGYIIAPEDGAFAFELASDDAGRFWLSSNDMPSGLPVAYLASVNSYSSYNQFDKEANQRSVTTVTLTNGQKYFYRVCFTQGGGGAGFHVGWSAPSDYGTWNSTIPANCYAASGDPSQATVSITSQPTGVTVLQGGKATFSIAATGYSMMGTNVTYQWRRNGTNIAGATGTNYTVALANLSDNGAVFDCVAGLPFAAQTSSPATLTVTPDKVAPVVLSAGAFFGDTNIGVRFSKPITPAATGLTYTVPGYNVLGVTFRTNSLLDGTNGDMVVLAVDNPISEGLTVTVASGFIDRWGNSGVGKTVPVELCTMTAVDVGNGAGTDPVFPGSTVPTSANSFQLIGGGSDIWLGTDACQYVYMPYSGNFDARARVANVSAANFWSKAGLLIRSGTNGTEKMVYNVVTAPTGQNSWDLGYRGIVSSNALNFPATSRPSNPPYPNAWVRITREGDVFTCWRSTDGANWIMIETRNMSDIAFPTDVLVGVAATAHDNTSATASYTTSDVYDFSVQPYTPDPTAPTIVFSFANGVMNVSWPASATSAGFVFQWSGDLNGGWTTSGIAPTIVGDRATRTINTTDTIRFFRLIKP